MVKKDLYEIMSGCFFFGGKVVCPVIVTRSIQRNDYSRSTLFNFHCLQTQTAVIGRDKSCEAYMARPYALMDNSPCQATLDRDGVTVHAGKLLTINGFSFVADQAYCCKQSSVLCKFNSLWYKVMFCPQANFVW